MAWTDPTERATGFLVTAAVYNADLIDNLAWVHGADGDPRALRYIDVSGEDRLIDSQFGTVAGVSGSGSIAFTFATPLSIVYAVHADVIANEAVDVTVASLDGGTPATGCTIRIERKVTGSMADFIVYMTAIGVA